MNIALDYDGTYTEDSELWELFIKTATTLGHTVYLVTMRYPEEGIRHNIGCPIYYTSRQAKRRFMEENHGIKFQVWIDDIPEFILLSSKEQMWPPSVSDEYSCQTEDCNVPTRTTYDDHCVVCQRAMRKPS